MFTLMIFAYSIIICATFKKEESVQSISAVKANVKTTPLKVEEDPMHAEKITASVSPVRNVNQ